MLSKFNTGLCILLALSLFNAFCSKGESTEVAVTNEFNRVNNSNERPRLEMTGNSDPAIGPNNDMNGESNQIDRDPFDLPLALRSKGVFFKAFLAAFEVFKADSLIPDDKRNIENYDIEFRENKEYIFIYFSAHSSPEDKLHPSDGGETTLGKSVMFIITKKDFAVKRHYFFS